MWLLNSRANIKSKKWHKTGCWRLIFKIKARVVSHLDGEGVQVIEHHVVRFWEQRWVTLMTNHTEGRLFCVRSTGAGFPRRLENSQRCPCPCWAAPAAGVAVRQEDASACPRVWPGRRPAGTAREVSSTNLPNECVNDSVVFPENTPLHLTWRLKPVGPHQAQLEPGGVTSGNLLHTHVLNLGGKFYLRSSNKSKFLWSGVHLHYMFICLVTPRGSDTAHRCNGMLTR